MAPQWNTGGVSDLEGSGNKLTCTRAAGGDVSNALWEDGPDGGVTTGQHYWKVNVLDASEQSSLFVGITDKDKFKPGWALRALLYGRNLSSGSALLVEAFGPGIKSGDTIGIYVDIGENVKVYFDVNGTSLGLGFDLPKSTLKSVFPVVQFSGAGSIQIEKVSGAPADLSRPAPVYDGIEGNWELVKNEFKVGDAVQELPTDVTLKIKKVDGEKYSAHMRIVNTINFDIEKEGDTWTARGGMSTRMMGSPEAMKLEGQMQELKSNPTIIEVQGSNLLWTNTTATMESKWQRFTEEKSPVTRNPF